MTGATPLRSPGRAVLISFHYPPSKEVGGLRAQKVARALRDAGHDVKVICAGAGTEITPLVSEPGIEIIPVKQLRGPREWYASLKRKRPSQDGSDHQVERLEAGVESGAGPAWKRYINSFLWVPDARQGFIWPAVKAARALAPAGSLVYTTAPPFSAHLAGLFLRLSRKVRWVAEFRDPWTDNPWKPRQLRSRPADALNAWLEKRCINTADRIITVTDSVREILAGKLASARRSRVVVIRNGIDQLSPDAAPIAGKPLRVLHVGSVYHKRDPRPFFQALATIRTRCGLTSRDVAVSFVGNGRWYNGNSLEEYVRSLGLAEIVSFGDWVTHAESQKMVKASGLLLLLAQEQPLQVPNKLYEYLGSGVPILAIADRGGETARMLNQVGGHYVVPPDDAPALEAALEEALLLRKPATTHTPDRAILGEWTTTEQMRKLQRLLSEDSR